jgi:hypothetical protein
MRTWFSAGGPSFAHLSLVVEQADDEAPRTSFFQVTSVRLVVPVALRSSSRRIGHEDIPASSQALPGSDPASVAATHSHWRSMSVHVGRPAAADVVAGAPAPPVVGFIGCAAWGCLMRPD